MQIVPYKLVHCRSLNDDQDNGLLCKEAVTPRCVDSIGNLPLAQKRLSAESDVFWLSAGPLISRLWTGVLGFGGLRFTNL